MVSKGFHSTANAQGLRGLAADIGGSPVCPVPSKNSAAVPHLAIFPLPFSITLSTKTLVVPTVIRSFAALSAPVPPRTPQLFLASLFFRHPFSYTFHEDGRPNCHSKFRAASCSPSHKFFRPQRTPQLLLTCGFSDAFSLCQHPQFNVCARSLTWKGCIDNVEKPKARLSSAGDHAIVVPTVIRSFAALSAPFPPKAPQLFLNSRFFRHPFSNTFHEDSRPHGHSKFRAASCSPSHKFSVLKDLRRCSSLCGFFRRRLGFKGKTCCRCTILPKPSARSLWRMQSAAPGKIQNPSDPPAQSR